MAHDVAELVQKRKKFLEGVTTEITQAEIQTCRVILKLQGVEAAVKYVIRKQPDQRWVVRPEGNATYKAPWTLWIRGDAVEWLDTPMIDIEFDNDDTNIVVMYLYELLGLPTEPPAIFGH